MREIWVVPSDGVSPAFAASVTSTLPLYLVQGSSGLPDYWHADVCPLVALSPKTEGVFDQIAELGFDHLTHSTAGLLECHYAQSQTVTEQYDWKYSYLGPQGALLPDANNQVAVIGANDQRYFVLGKTNGTHVAARTIINTVDYIDESGNYLYTEVNWDVIVNGLQRGSDELMVSHGIPTPPCPGGAEVCRELAPALLDGCEQRFDSTMSRAA